MKFSSKDIFLWGAMVLGILSVVAISWEGYRQYVRWQEKPVMEAVNLAKQGQYAEALPKLEHFSRRGNLLAKRMLAEMYTFELGVPYDEEMAVRLERESHSGTGTPGGYELYVAKSYLTGDTVKFNSERAISWLVRSAEAGNIEARRLLANPGELMSFGAVSVDDVIVDYWKFRAAGR